MLGALLLLAACSSAEVPQAAFTARVYLPGKARSYYDVYLWRGPELGSERLYSSDRDCHGVRWIDRDRLRWVEFEGYWSGSRTMYAMQLDLSTFKVSVLQKEMLEPSHYRSETRTDYRISAPYGLEVLKGAHVPEFVDVEPTGVEIPNQQSSSHSSIFEFQGKRLKAGMDYHGLAQFIPGRTAGEFFLYDGTFAMSAGSWAGLWRLDFKSGEVEHVIDGPTQIEFHPDTPFWCGSTSRKWLIEFDGMRLWHEKGFVGNWQTGEVWNAMPKPSTVSSIALRPSRGA